MTGPFRTTYALGAFAGLSLVGTLAGCAATSTAAATDPTSTPATNTTPSPGATAGTDTTTAKTSTTYKNGTYSAEGHYTSPAGNDSIEVKVTLTNDVITALTVTPNATNPNAIRYQGDFISGIKAVVVGKKIDSLHVSRVAGSSLTSTGFNAAIKTIEANALG
jgi:uncharacterized protein with FMN-binding domain